VNSLSLSIIINSLYIPGIASSSFGKQTIASGDYANAFGERSEARGRSSMVSGERNRANGRASVASGLLSLAQGAGSFAQLPISHPGQIRKRLVVWRLRRSI